MTKHPNRQAYRTAVAWLYALKNDDRAGLQALANDSGHPATLAAMSDMFLGLAAISTNGNPDQYLEHVRDNMDQYLDQYEERDQ